MMIRRILAPVGGTEAARPAVEMALTVAEQLAAHVEGMHVRPDPQEAIPLLGEGVSGAMIDELITLTEKEGTARAAAAKAVFEKACEERTIPFLSTPSAEGPSAQWRQFVGREDDLIVRRGRLADLIVLARPTRSEESPSLATFNAALFESGRPVLVVPQGAPHSFARRIAIAWNGSAEAARAVSAAIVLLGKAETVVVYSAASAATPAEAAEEQIEYLAWHGIAAEVGSLPDKAHSAGAALLEACDGANIDLLVMGAYTHSRLRQMILGGVTKHVLEWATLPLLMAH